MSSLRREREQLLRDAATRRHGGTGGNAIVTVVVCVLLVALIVFVLSRFIKISVDVQVGNKNATGNRTTGPPSWWFHSHNTLLGVKKCRQLNCDELDFLNDTCKRKVSSFLVTRNFSYYFVTDDAALTFTQSCSLESFVKQLPETTVYSLRLLCNRRPEEYPGPDVRRELSRTYRNLKLISINGQCFFKNTPFDDEWRCGNDHVLRGAQAIVVWRFGGVSVYPDVLLVNASWSRETTQMGRTCLGEHVVASVLPCSAPIYHYVTVVERSRSTFLADPTRRTFNKFCKKAPCPLLYLSDRDVCGNWAKCSLGLISRHHATEKLQMYCPKSISLYKSV